MRFLRGIGIVTSRARIRNEDLQDRVKVESMDFEKDNQEKSITMV